MNTEIARVSHANMGDLLNKLVTKTSMLVFLLDERKEVLSSCCKSLKSWMKMAVLGTQRLRVTNLIFTDKDQQQICSSSVKVER